MDSLEDLTNRDANVIDLHVALNAKFLLNTYERDELKAMRPIDLVALRKPKHLLINIGANHGLIDITLRGLKRTQNPAKACSAWPNGRTKCAVSPNCWCSWDQRLRRST